MSEWNRLRTLVDLLGALDGERQEGMCENIERERKSTTTVSLYLVCKCVCSMRSSHQHYYAGEVRINGSRAR